MPDRKIINMTPYEVELFSPINMKRVRIPSLGEIRGRASRSAEPDEFAGEIPGYATESLRPIGVPARLEPDSVYIVTGGAAAALREAGYDMSRFRLVSGAVLRSEPYGAGQRCFIEGSGLARIA